MASFADKPIEFQAFAGLRNNTAAERLDLKDLQVAENVDIDDTGRIVRRLGKTSRLAGATHSIWSPDKSICLAVQGTTLKRVRATGTASYSLSTLRAGLTSGARMSYWAVNGAVYYSNGFETGIVQDGASRSWGLENPIGQPGATRIGGYLPAGRYQFALTYRRNDGQESGTGIAGTIDLASKGGIRFTGIPVSSDATVSHKVVYLTATNDELLYRAMVIANADTSAEYRNEGYDLRIPLKTQFGETAPAGQFVAWYRGHMLVASGSVLWRSMPFRHELFMLDKAFNVFAADINLLAPVNDGVYIGADKTYFLSGKSPDAWGLNRVAEYGAIPGTASYPVAEAGYAGEGIVALWASERGHCAGGDGGAFRNLTESRFSYPTAQRGAGIMRQLKGLNQYLAVLEGTGAANNAFS